ncbi:hypothetical protein [uncultured Arthrobacter sp.]|uniref:hypothetical protein n=1 Tax=uncultured Arthrobacter sp. TaxID=114050 RepID=UPI00261CA250|nr:hypothetical protein [uncultured Arthrobacter sp.]
MTAAAGARGGLKAHQDSIRLPDAELVRDLRYILGAKLVAYIGSVKETRAVRQWAGGEAEALDRGDDPAAACLSCGRTPG